MATTYKQTLKLSVWKEHACLHCGQRFRYLLERKKTGQGRTSDAAQSAARRAVFETFKKDVDFHPCPGCGLIQPDMVGSLRASLHRWLALGTTAVLVGLLVLTLYDVLTTSTALLAATGGCGLLGLLHLLVDSNNPNRSLERNRQTAQHRVERGALWVVPERAGSPAGAAQYFGWSRAHSIAYVVLLLSLAALVVPEAVRLRHGWPVNSSWYPQVAGPGDAPYIYLPSEITSVKGYWHGTARAEILNAADIGLAGTTLSASSQDDGWGTMITINRKESSTRNHTLRPSAPRQRPSSCPVIRLRPC